MENQYLPWVKLCEPFLSLTALEQFIGLPAMTLHRYLKTGVFPEKHLPKLKEKLEPICHLEPAWLTTYVQGLVEERNSHLENNRNAIINARQEQIVDDIARLYLAIHLENPDLARSVGLMMQQAFPFMKNIMDYLKGCKTPASLEDLRQLPRKPEMPEPETDES